MTPRVALAERVLTLCTVLGCCVFAILSVLAACVVLDWALNRVVRTFRLCALFLEFMWSRRKARRD